MGRHISKSENFGAKLAFGQRITTVDRFVPNLVLLVNFKATTFTNDAHKVAVIKLVRAQNELIIGQLVGAFLIVALETNVVQICLLELVQTPH